MEIDPREIAIDAAEGVAADFKNRKDLLEVREITPVKCLSNNPVPVEEPVVIDSQDLDVRWERCEFAEETIPGVCTRVAVLNRLRSVNVKIPDPPFGPSRVAAHSRSPICVNLVPEAEEVALGVVPRKEARRHGDSAGRFPQASPSNGAWHRARFGVICSVNLGGVTRPRQSLGWVGLLSVLTKALLTIRNDVRLAVADRAGSKSISTALPLPHQLTARTSR